MKFWHRLPAVTRRPLLILVYSVLAVSAISLVVGENPFNVLGILVTGSWGSSRAIGYTLFTATSLIFTGLSVLWVFRAGLFNIGGEGQIYVGALGAYVASRLCGAMPAPLLWAGTIAGCLAGGAAWGALAGWFRTQARVHEVITTILLNFLAYALFGYGVLEIFRDPQSAVPESRLLPPSLQINGLIADTPFNLSFVAALLLCLASYFFFQKTWWGWRLRAVEANPRASQLLGLRPERAQLAAFALGGALAALVFFNDVTGLAHRLREGFSPLYGFMGIAVAMLADKNPLAIIPAALFWASLQQGARNLDLDTERISREVGFVIQGLLILVASTRLQKEKA